MLYVRCCNNMLVGGFVVYVTHIKLTVLKRKVSLFTLIEIT